MFLERVSDNNLIVDLLTLTGIPNFSTPHQLTDGIHVLFEVRTVAPRFVRFNPL